MMSKTIISLFYSAKVNIKSSSSCVVQTLMLIFTIFRRTALSLVVLHTKSVHFYTDKLKDKVKKVTVRMIYDTRGFKEVHNTDNIPLLLMNLFCIL